MRVTSASKWHVILARMLAVHETSGNVVILALVEVVISHSAKLTSEGIWWD